MVLTSVRLQQGAGSVSPALMATLPTKRKIVGELIDEAGTVFLSDPALIAKPRRAIESAAIWRGGGGTADGANLFSVFMALRNPSRKPNDAVVIAGASDHHCVFSD